MIPEFRNTGRNPFIPTIDNFIRFLDLAPGNPVDANYPMHMECKVQFVEVCNDKNIVGNILRRRQTKILCQIDDRNNGVARFEDALDHRVGILH